MLILPESRSNSGIVKSTAGLNRNSIEVTQVRVLVAESETWVPGTTRRFPRLPSVIFTRRLIEKTAIPSVHKDGY